MNSYGVGVATIIASFSTGTCPDDDTAELQHASFRAATGNSVHDADVVQGGSIGQVKPGKLVTPRFAKSDIMKAYDKFGNAARKVR